MYSAAPVGCGVFYDYLNGVLYLSLQRVRKDVNAVANEHGLNKLFDIPFFQHIKMELEYEDIRQILTIIGEDIYPKAWTFGATDIATAVPEDHTRKETIGAQAERAKKQLDVFMREPEKISVPSEEQSEWLRKFLSEKRFQSCVFQLLDSLVRYVQNQLPDNKLLPSFEERVKAVARDNAEEFEDEIGKAEAARESAERAQKAAEEAKNAAESIIPNMLTTLGVFIAIVIAIVGCYLSVLLSNHVGNNAKTLDMSMILLMGHILMNTIFLLLYLISKMSVHSLACHCMEGHQRDCSRCSPDLCEKCSLWNKVWLRYPYVVAMNGAFVAAYCVLGLWYLIERYLGMDIDQVLKDNQGYAVIVVVSTAILIVSVGVFVFLFLLRGPRHRMEAEKKKAKAGEKREQKAEAKKEIKHVDIYKLRGEVSELAKQITVLKNEL